MHKITEQYQTDIKKYEDFKLKIEVLVKELIVQKGINFHKIESRTKDISKLEDKILTCSHKITPSGRRESTKIKMGDSSYEKDIYR